MIGAQPSIGTPLPDSGSRTLTEKKPGGAGIVKVFCSIRMALILFDHIGRLWRCRFCCPLHRYGLHGLAGYGLAGAGKNSVIA